MPASHSTVSKELFSVSEILDLQAETVVAWHLQPITNPYAGVKQLVCEQHRFNFELWHQEDIARSQDVTAETIAQVKRAIDGFNQKRNDHIEKIDDWLTAELHRLCIEPIPDAKLNSETPGSAIDRLSIMSLRLFHYQQQLDRTDVDSDHLQRVSQRIALCSEQRKDLSQSLEELLSDILAGRKQHKTYRQMKMYNDPTLNPYLYEAQKAIA